MLFGKQILAMWIRYGGFLLTGMVGVLATCPAAAFDPQEHLFGDPWQLRSALQDAGITFLFREQSEAIWNVSGGLKHGGAYFGELTFGISVNTGTLGLWPGGTFRVSGKQLRGGVPTSRLNTIYYDQRIFDGTVSVRIGQYFIDNEFIRNTYNTSFENAAFDIPPVTANGLPQFGGKPHPFLAPNLRVKFSPSPTFTLLAAAFSGDSIGYNRNIAERVSGGNVSAAMSGGTLWIAEAQYAGDPGSRNAALASTYRIGGYLHTQSFADQRLDARSGSLADPASIGIPMRRRGNWNVYAGFDQRLWSDPHGDGLDRGVGAFGLAIVGPADRNVIDISPSAGLIWVGPLDARPADVIGFGVNYAHFSQQARALDADRVRFGARQVPIRDSEVTLEFNYQAAVGPFQFVPNLQYIIHPSGGIVAPGSVRRVVPNAVAAGVILAVNF
jgi:porin